MALCVRRRRPGPIARPAGAKQPQEAFDDALGALQAEVEEMKGKFILEMHRMNREQEGGAGGMDYQ